MAAAPKLGTRIAAASISLRIFVLSLVERAQDEIADSGDLRGGNGLGAGGFALNFYPGELGGPLRLRSRLFLPRSLNCGALGFGSSRLFGRPVWVPLSVPTPRDRRVVKVRTVHIGTLPRRVRRSREGNGGERQTDRGFQVHVLLL